MLPDNSEVNPGSLIWVANINPPLLAHRNQLIWFEDPAAKVFFEDFCTHIVISDGSRFIKKDAFESSYKRLIAKQRLPSFSGW